MRQNMNHKLTQAVILLITLSYASAVYAGVGKVSSPQVHKGEAEIEYNATRTGDDDDHSLNNAQKHTLEFEYGITDRWMLGLEFEATREVPSHTDLKGAGFETQYEMTKQGDWWLSSAIKGEFLFAHEPASPDEGELVLIGQRAEGRARITANLAFEREFGNNRNGGVSVSSAIEGLYRYRSLLSPGIEWHAEYGNADDFSADEDQEHYLGPIVKGTLFEIGDGAVGYEVGYFWGLTSASADDAQRIKIAYEFHF